MNLKAAISLFHSTIIIHTVLGVGQSPPRIIKQPPTDEIIFRASAGPFRIECEAEGEPLPKYRWTKNGENIDWNAYSDRISIQPDTGTLIVYVLIDEDVGQYQCFAENEWGVANEHRIKTRDNIQC